MAGAGAGTQSGGGQSAGQDRKIEHKRNVVTALAGATTPAQRAEVVLRGTVGALRAKLKRMVADFEEEIAYMESQIPEMVAAIEHGVKQ